MVLPVTNTNNSIIDSVDENEIDDNAMSFNEAPSGDVIDLEDSNEHNSQHENNLNRGQTYS